MDKLRCDTASWLRDIGDGGARQAQDKKSKTVRNLLTLAHHKFKLFIRNKAAEVGATVLDVSEAYTTKTVSWTGDDA